ncbi:MULTISPECIES: sigma-70 family RNA polymerase sigma factor [Lichenihabitans]|uniref:sigma-70 family RNA polymerase sigma factor n=1 Tax=Lichenihabitans TaxID=2723776 RepID=UPI0010357BD5|nr:MULTISPECIES: sigma-70 family RNA polymerase sigma factor [Lichenihabitans]UDL95126.1 sigma-70 family RNA polymerase sigma factor [Lichenihabitans sp. PAMC28606]
MLGSSRELAVVLQRVAQRDQAAFEVLYNATNRKLYGIVLRILVSRSLADEILQEVYVKIWQKAVDFDPGKASPITWMAVIARNRALDEVRRPSHSAMQDDISEGLEIPAEVDHPLDSMERSDSFKALLVCLQTLDPERREILLLAYYRGLSRDALARRFNHPTATIKTWLHRSLAQLKNCLAS